jgi:hypothetical protein
MRSSLLDIITSAARNADQSLGTPQMFVFLRGTGFRTDVCFVFKKVVLYTYFKIKNVIKNEMG